MKYAKLVLRIFLLTSTMSYAQNSTCVTVIDKGVDALNKLNIQIERVINETVPKILERVTSIENTTIPNILETVQDVKQTIADRTSRTYLVGTMALAAFGVVIVTAVTYGVFRLTVWKVQQAKGVGEETLIEKLLKEVGALRMVIEQLNTLLKQQVSDAQPVAVRAS